MPDFVRTFRTRLKSRQLHRFALGQIALLLGWMLLASVLRLHHLTLKPLWTDEFSTLVFGLGHSFKTVPLNQIIDANTLLAPIRPTLDTTMADAARQLLTESNHPPLYFMLTHNWTRLFPNPEGYVSIWGARSLAVVFGVLAVPAMYLAGWSAFRSRVVAHLAAALMAVSPFGIYLAQDARHYTLTVVWMILSLTCLMQAVRHIHNQKPLPFTTVILWILVNGLGMASHYFFIVTLSAETITLGIMLFVIQQQQSNWHWNGRDRIGMAIAGTTAAIAVWLPFILAIRREDALTQWLSSDGWKDWAWVNPVLHTLASIGSMVMLLPVQNVDESEVIASGIGIAGLITALVWFSYRGIRVGLTRPVFQVPLLTFLIFTTGAIATILMATYGLGIELAQVFRYHFVYFPGLLLLVAASMAVYWHPSGTNSPGINAPHHFPRTRWLVILLVVIGIIGSVTVTMDMGYRKLHRPDRIVRSMAKRSEAPILVAISHQTHGQTGRLMALAWEMRSPSYSDKIQPDTFLLDHQDCKLDNDLSCHHPSDNLKQLVNDYPRPLDMWLVNYEDQANLRRQGCDYQHTKRADGYKAQHYTCR